MRHIFKFWLGAHVVPSKKFILLFALANLHLGCGEKYSNDINFPQSTKSFLLNNVDFKNEKLIGSRIEEGRKGEFLTEWVFVGEVGKVSTKFVEIENVKDNEKKVNSICGGKLDGVINADSALFLIEKNDGNVIRVMIFRNNLQDENVKVIHISEQKM